VFPHQQLAERYELKKSKKILPFKSLSNFKIALLSPQIINNSSDGLMPLLVKNTNNGAFFSW